MESFFIQTKSLNLRFNKKRIALKLKKPEWHYRT